MGEYWRGEITLRKLRVLAEGLPQVGPHTRHATNGIDYGFTDAMLWSVKWELMLSNVIASRAAGDKKAKMPAEKMPAFPWEKPDNGQESMGGDLGENTQEEVLDFLMNL